MKLYFLFLFLLCSSDLRAGHISNCLKAFVQKFLVDDYSPAQTISAQGAKEVPVREGVTRDRIMWDFVALDLLDLLHEGPNRIVLKHHSGWIVSFLRREDGSITHCDFGESDEQKREWMARTLRKRGVLDFYFEERFISDL